MAKYIFLILWFFLSVSMAKLPELNAEQKSLKISQMSVDIKIVANIATTTMDIEYYNPYDRDLTGEFSMPLREGEKISRYALVVDGRLREGVVVDKVKAREAFEAVVRKKIDPGIANITKGNYFKTKIYPIPAKGYKRVVVETTQQLNSDYYILPIQDQKPIDKFTLNIEITKSSADEQIKLLEFNQIHVTEDNQAYVVHFQKENFALKRPIKFRLPKMDRSNYQLFTQTIDNKRYFYLHLTTPKLSKKEKKAPKSIAIYWDNSFSAKDRDVDRELKLLDSYLKSIGGTKNIYLIPFNYRLGKSKKFKIDQDTSSLMRYIKSLKNDGGTTLSRLKLNLKSDEILIFSDGINTIGKESVKIGKKPIYSITSSSGSNYSFLKKISSGSRGEFINLSNLTNQEALSLLTQDEEKFLSCSYKSSEMGEIYPKVATHVGKTVDIVGVLKREKAKLIVNFGDQNGITKRETFIITKGRNSPNISYLWASKKIDFLSLDREKNRDAIKRLSQKYNIVTRDTAFIVLDSVEDYVKYKIRPPRELREEYDRIMSQLKKDKRDKQKEIKADNLRRIKKLKDWYRDPPKINMKKSRDGDEDVGELGGDIAPVVEASPPSEPMLGDRASSKKSNKSKRENSSIEILSWVPDAPYMKKLRSLSIKSFDKYYYEFKKSNLNRPAFYIEVSDYLFKRGLHKRAVRVLTNVVELDLENPELLKVVAKRLMDEKEYSLAIMIYKEIKSLRPDEPQSYRDLAIAYKNRKNYQKSLDYYNYILSKDWGRFNDIKDVIFNELNALISQHRRDINLKKVDRAYIYHMPLDIRITVSWSSNDNDIDLWVVDPNGEKCYYVYPNTKMGGKISRDFTQGYGPEEFTLKKAKRGSYIVYLHYFSESRQSITGPVTIHGKLTTHYGTKKEKSKKIMIQLERDKDSMQIGILNFKQ
jgi:tetratricopeptide (TPR) repeat protein